MYPHVQAVSRRSGDFNFRALRAAPTLTTPVTYVPGDIHIPSSSYLYSSHGGTHNVGRDMIWDGNFSSGVTLNDFTATGVADYRFVNAVGSIFGSATLADHSVDSVTDSDRWKIYGLDESNPWLCRTQTQNGFQLASRNGGATYLIQNAVVDTPGASGLTANFGTSSSRFYNSLIINDFRVIGYVINSQEGIYIGHTSAGFDYLQDVFITNFLTIGRGREGLQLGHINNVNVSGFTLIDVGKGGVSGQQNIIQVHDCNGIIENGICDRAPTPFNIFTHGVTFRNCLFRWTALKGFIGDIATHSYFTGGTARTTGAPVIFENCHFWKDFGGTDVIADLEEKGCNFEWRRCGFSSNISNSIVNDTRGGGLNQIIGTTTTNGNYTVSYPSLTYQSQLYSDYTTHGLVDAGFYRNLGMGFRTR